MRGLGISVPLPYGVEIRLKGTEERFYYLGYSRTSYIDNKQGFSGVLIEQPFL